MYGNIAMPPPEYGLKEIMKDGQRIEYRITIEVAELVSKAKVREMEIVNRETDRKLWLTSDAMREFNSKGDYDPRTDREKELYGKYQQQLRVLPYHRLPDLYDAVNSYFISTTRRRNASFSYPREERECRAVLGNIYSFADAYSDLVKAAEDDEFFSYPWDRKVDQAFMNGRDYDMYLATRTRNLRDSK